MAESSKKNSPSPHEEIPKSKRKLSASNAEMASTSKWARNERSRFNTLEAKFVNSDLDFDISIKKTSLDNSAVIAGKDSLRVDLVENAKVTEILQNLSPDFKLPDNSRVNQVALTSRYETLKKQVEQELKEVQFIALSIDFMRDSNLKDYLNVTCRFITSDWEMKSRTLQTLYISDIFNQSSVSVLSKAVKEITDLWSVTDKVVAITVPTNHKWEKRIFQRTTFNCIGCRINLVFSL